MRRHGRICAMQVLYQMDLVHDLEPCLASEAAAHLALQRYFTHFEAVEPAERAFAERLVHGVAAALPDLDAALSGVSQHWKLTRMGRVDRNLLRLAAYEILRCSDIPRAASINEAIEIAKSFGTRESAAFVNGILDQLEGGPQPVDAPREEAPVEPA